MKSFANPPKAVKTVLKRYAFYWEENPIGTHQKSYDRQHVYDAVTNIR